jgi:hypothetical protein
MYYKGKVLPLSLSLSLSLYPYLSHSFHDERDTMRRAWVPDVLQITYSEHLLCHIDVLDMSRIGELRPGYPAAWESVVRGEERARA